jgi:hypothetical protein
VVDDPDHEEDMTQPQINTLEYIRRALSDQQNSAVVTQNVDGTLTIALDIGPGPHLVDLEALEGPAGPVGPPQFPLQLMPDVYTDPLDLPNNLLTNSDADIGKYWLITQSDEDGVISTGAYIWFGTEYRFLPFIVPSKAFSSYSDIDFSMPVSIVTFPVPPMPFPWKPLVFGQIEMQGSTWWQSLPDKIGVIILLGDSDPEVGTLVGRGFGNAPRGVVTVMPHCSYPQHPAGPGEPAGVTGSDSLAMTPWNDIGAVSENHTGAEGTLYVVLVNEGKAVGNNSRFNFNAAGSSLFVLVCPMTSQDQLAPPQYAGFTTQVKLTALIT